MKKLQPVGAAPAAALRTTVPTRMRWADLARCAAWVSFAAVGAVVIDCGPQPRIEPTTPERVTSASVASSGSVLPSSSASIVLEPPGAEVERVKALGPEHAPVVRVMGANGQPERFAVFLGSEKVLNALWIVARADPKPRPVAIPLGARVLGAVAGSGRLHVWLESLAALDQPAGLRGVMVIDTSSGDRLFEDGPTSMSELEKRAALPIAKGPVPSASAAPKASASTTPQPPATPREFVRSFPHVDSKTLSPFVPKGGLRVFRVWQGVFKELLATIDVASLDSSPHLGRVKSAFGRTWSEGCNGLRCGGVEVGREGDRFHVAGILLDPDEESPSTLPPQPRKVATNSGPFVTAAALRMLVAEPVTKIVGEAPLGPPGATIGLARIDRKEHRWVRVIVDPSYASVEELLIGDDMDQPIVRFADLDGDGRTDLAVQTSGEWKGKATTERLAFHSARSVQRGTTLVDDATRLSLFIGADLDAGVANALALPRKAVAVADACKVLKKGQHNFVAVSAPKAAIFSYALIGDPHIRPRKRTLKELSFGFDGCDAITCEPDRPVCIHDAQPPKTFFLFGWKDKKLVVEAVQYYATEGGDGS